MPTIEELITALNAPDERSRRRAGDELAAYGEDALPALVAALRHDAARVRQSASYLLGRVGGQAEAAALAGALSDEDTKVRKNVAVALGRVGGPEQAEALTHALAHEAYSYVRASLALALGATGGQAAFTTLAAIVPESDEEREALRKALDRTAPARPTAVWVVDGWRPRAVLECPPGLERIAADEVYALGHPRPQRGGEGLLRLVPEVPPDDLRATLRCSFGVLLTAGSGPALPLDDPNACGAAVSRLVGSSMTLQRWREWVAADGDELRIRLAFGPRTRAETARAVLDAVRSACAPFGIIDSPSRYDAELVIESDYHGTQLFVRPSFATDERFDYRIGDVPAAVDPVIAAGLARLVRTQPEGRSPIVFDPTCGSGTLLVERAILGGVERLHGLDILQDAVQVATTNIAAAGLAGTIQIRRGDAMQQRSWLQCDEVLANLPFGLRTQMFERDIPQLYASVAQHVARSLRPGGRAVFYTARPDLIDDALNAVDGLLPGERIRILAGGITVTAVVAIREAEVQARG